MMSHYNHLFGYLTFGIMLQSPKYRIQSWIRQKLCSEQTNAMSVYNTTRVLISMHVGLQMHKQNTSACMCDQLLFDKNYNCSFVF